VCALRTVAILVGVFVLLPFGATALITVGALDTPGSALGVEVVDGLAYVADYDSGLRIIDFGPEYHVVPEPSAVAILASGIAMLWLLKRRRMRT
jgi:hypothetical protein